MRTSTLTAFFAAFGYDPGHAERRANKEVKAVRRRVLKGVEEAGSPLGEIRVRPLSAFTENEVYQIHRRRVEHFFATGDEFRKGAEEMALYFLGPKLPEGACVSDEQLQVCYDYIAAELPFFLDTPGILGVPSSVSAYHTHMPITEVLYGRGGGLRANRNQAYAVVRPEGSEHVENRAA
ncbi:tRNA-dependent cyclodipeptide synthase [Streptomyces sp. NPDC006879]|uniref:tRNA-dependent cyclodipeptide synthase n=1 Tax=Streptomyces sp. NPDC006879 TaxID=3364767 RepID=UPI0036892840